MGIDPTDARPLYLQIADDVRTTIEEGALAVGDRLGSHKELANQYDVSLITVKKAMSELIRDGILYARVGKGTFVARSAPAVNHEDHRSVGVVLPDLTEPFFSEIVQGVEELAHTAGYNLLLSTLTGKSVEPTGHGQIEHFRRIGVDGLIIALLGASHRATDEIYALHKANVPYVMVSYVDEPEIYYVGIDHEDGAYLATAHLLREGYSKVGYLGDEPGNVLSELRKSGYRRALEDFGIEPDDRFIFDWLKGPGWRKLGSGVEAGNRIAALSERPDAIFAYNDIAALGLQRALLTAGLVVPDDVAMVGFDDIELAGVAPVPLTTIRQPVDEICRQAMDVLSHRISHRPAPARTVLAPELIIRESSGGASHPDR